MTGEHEIQGIGVSRLAADYGTPLFVYDGAVLASRFQRLRDSLHPALEIFYSLKANPNIAVTAVLRQAGACAEVSSLAELATALRAGVPADDVVFLGPGKSREELAACLLHRVHAIICESPGELAVIGELADARGSVAPVALRLNPDFGVKGSALTMGGKPRQFGIDAGWLLDGAGRADLMAGRTGVRLMGIHAYLGTRILSAGTVAGNTARILRLADRVARRFGFPLAFVDVGGGLGVAYFDGERDLDLSELADRVNPIIGSFAADHPGTRLAMEVGRYLTADAGLYIVGVRYVKKSMGERFAVADGGTNHHMAAVGTGTFVKRNFPMRLLTRPAAPADEVWNVTGPLCTPNDILGRKIALPAIQPGDLIGVFRSGAYGPSASPGLFLSHGYPAEVLVQDGTPHLVRERDTVEDLLRPQRLPDPAALAMSGTARRGTTL